MAVQCSLALLLLSVYMCSHEHEWVSYHSACESLHHSGAVCRYVTLTLIRSTQVFHWQVYGAKHNGDRAEDLFRQKVSHTAIQRLCQTDQYLWDACGVCNSATERTEWIWCVVSSLLCSGTAGLYWRWYSLDQFTPVHILSCLIWLNFWIWHVITADVCQHASLYTISRCAKNSNILGYRRWPNMSRAVNKRVRVVKYVSEDFRYWLALVRL